MPGGMTHRDQVHGDIYYDKLAAALIDSAPMQRLGRVNQLGYASLVFRGGNHSRLSHVMGAYGLAGRFVDALRRNYESDATRPLGAVDPDLFLPWKQPDQLEDRWAILRFLVGWAALLHDTGHVPLGHTLEDEFDKIFVKHDDFRSPRIPHLWIESSPGHPAEIRRLFLREELLPDVFLRKKITGEMVWQAVMIICFHKSEKDRNGVTTTFADLISGMPDGLTKTEFARAYAAVEPRLFAPYMADIVADTICADFLDYLRRDASNLGLDVLRDDRVTSHFWIGRRRNSGQLHMALSLVDRRGKPRLDTTTGVVDLVRQRYRFAEIVYYHKSKGAASAMFAKALHLVPRVNECPSEDRIVVESSSISGIVSELFESQKRGAGDIQKFVQEVLPNSLLDPEIGDDSLHLLMQQKAAEELHRAVVATDRTAATNALRALALLHAIARRRLYKVMFAMDSSAWNDFFRGSKRGVAAQELNVLIARLRSEEGYRDKLEGLMKKSLQDYPEFSSLEDPFIIYVPPRKSQAKGIETGALDEGEVITLGEHDAVQTQVADLNIKYSNLWKLVVFVHPSLRDPIVQSRAARVLVEEIASGVDQVHRNSVS